MRLQPIVRQQLAVRLGGPQAAAAVEAASPVLWSRLSAALLQTREGRALADNLYAIARAEMGRQAADYLHRCDCAVCAMFCECCSQQH